MCTDVDIDDQFRLLRHYCRVEAERFDSVLHTEYPRIYKRERAGVI